MDRLYFQNKKDRINFFNKVKSYQKSWKRIKEILKTSRSMVDHYRLGRLCIPKNRFVILINLIPENEREYFWRKIEKKANNWGQIIGGKRAYEINKDKFDEGRKKAIKKVKYEFDINLPLSEELCEFIGAIIGDGFTNRYNNFYQTQITGDNLFDSNYYYNRLKPFCENLFNISPKITSNKGWIRLNIYSKRLFEMLTKRFDIPAGKKCYTVTIPDEILKSEEKFINATLKGMFDTDGGVGFDKRKSYKKPYIRINYTSASKGLIDQISSILSTYSIKHSIHKQKNFRSHIIQMNGEKNVRLFLKKIGFSNSRHLKKVYHLL